MAQGDQLRVLHTPSVAMERYVNPSTGNDSNDGSSGSPWATLQGAITYMRTTLTWPGSGDVRVNISDGTYQASSAAAATMDLDFSSSATRAPAADRWLIWNAVNPGKVIVVPPDGATGTKEAIRCRTAATFNCRYLQFRGIDVDGKSLQRGAGDVIGFSVESANVEIINCWVRRLVGAPTQKAQGIFGWVGSDDLYVHNTVVHHIGRIDGTVDQEHGFYLQGDRAQLTQCLVYDAINGFCVQFFNGSGGANAIIANCTIVGSRDKSGIIISGDVSNVKIKNTIIAYNLQNGIEYYPAPTGVATGCVLDRVIYFANTTNRSATPGGWTITNETTADPRFRNRVFHDYQLAAGSPAIGFSDTGFCNPTDLDGRTRTTTTEDAGVYEFSGYHRPFNTEKFPKRRITSN